MVSESKVLPPLTSLSSHCLLHWPQAKEQPRFPASTSRAFIQPLLQWQNIVSSNSSAVGAETVAIGSRNALRIVPPHSWSVNHSLTKFQFDNKHDRNVEMLHLLLEYLTTAQVYSVLKLNVL